MPLLSFLSGPRLGQRRLEVEGTVVRGKQAFPSQDRVELSFMSRAEEYRMNARAEGIGGGLNRAMRSVTTQEEHRVCGSPACTTGWNFPWKSRKYPIFEQRWACSSRCLMAIVTASIAREAGTGRRDVVEVQHQHRVPLGLVMLGQGWITHSQLQRALQAQRAEGAGRIGDWLVSVCGLDKEVVTRGLSVQWGCPVLTTEGFSPTAMAMAVPRIFIEQFGILPLRLAGTKILYVGFEDHLDASSAFAVEQMSGLRTESGVVVAASFFAARQRLLECKFAEITECRVPDRDTLAKAVATVIEQRPTVASRLVRLRQYYWLRSWTGASSSGRKANLPADAQDAADYIFTIGTPA